MRRESTRGESTHYRQDMNTVPKKKNANPRGWRSAFYLAEWTGLEPATPGVTGRYSNQLNYHSICCFMRLRNYVLTTWGQ